MKLLNDKELEIAVASSRKAKTWRNRKILWSELAERLSKTTRTPETVAEYKAMKRDKQSDVKDVGGFVGGYLNNGHRTDVRFRSVLALDADFAKPELWEDWCSNFGYAAAIYSTHKHTPSAPRLRLVIPLSRNVTPDEYQAIGRKVADSLADGSIDWFDDTTYQPERVMFWPSTSQDGEYIFRVNDGDFLDADMFLGMYQDWQDMSAWPVSSRVSELVRRATTKQQDPLGKPGLIGAFCRAYSITDAIDAFVPDYVPCDEPNRYTYAKGSTAAGVVVYEDKFSYSFHGTDPASMQLCNAWDLVRLHQFGELDEGTDPDIPVSSKPSYKAMAQLATEDPRVRAQIVEDRTAEAREDFADPLVETDWMAQLKITEKGGIAQTIDNIVIILEHDPSLVGRIAYNEMSHNVVLISGTPWHEVKGEAQWTDTDDANLRYYLERTYGISGKDKIFDAVNVVANKHKYHPVRDYLDSCDWDGVPRVDELLIKYLGADDTPYTRAVTRKTLAGAVARIYNPGVKFDYMLVLRSAQQGIGKTSLVKLLGRDWYSDSFSTVQGKEAYEQLHGVWIMEVGELAGMRKAEAESIKLFISKQVDRFRPAYGRRTEEFKRQCIFIGTTNETQFLRDTTGNRRFWVVEAKNTELSPDFGELDDALLKQIWGEAIQIWRKGEKLYLSHALEEEARRIQSNYEVEDPRAGLIEAYLNRLLPEDWDDMDEYSRKTWLDSDAVGKVERTIVSGAEIANEALGINFKKDTWVSKDIAKIMESFPEWRRGPSSVRQRLYGQQRYWRRVKR